jgi:general secretion pathway protein D
MIRSRVVRFALAALLLGAPQLARAQQPAAERARVRTIEVDRAARGDLVLVQVEGVVAPRLVVESPDRVVLELPDAVLEPRAPRKLPAAAGTAIRGVSASEAGSAVAIRIERTPGAAAQLSRQGALIAIEFPRPAPQEARVTLRLKGAPLVQLVNEVQRLTGETFIYDDRLQGTATVIVTAPVTKGEALEILHATLQGKGFAAVPAAQGEWLVLPVDDARSRAPLAARALSRERARLITTLVHFRDATAEQIVNALQTFTGATVTAVVHAPTNGVVLIGPESVLQRWHALARALDETSRRELAVIRPRWRSAAELQALLADSLVDPFTGRARAELFLDERTNALIARAEPAPLAALRTRIDELDAAPEGDGEIAVFRLRFADPQKIAVLLQGSADGSAATNARAGASALQLGAAAVVADAPSRSLLVSGGAEAQREVRRLLEQLDVAPPTIFVRAHVSEVVTTGDVALGVDAFLPTTDPSNPGRTVFGVGVGDPFGLAPSGGADPTFFGGYRRRSLFTIPVPGPDGQIVNVDVREAAQIRARAGELRVRSLMQPQLLMTSGEEHELSAGFNVPIPTAASDSAGGDADDPLTTRVSIERQDVGLRLRLKPAAGQAGDVLIAVELEVAGVVPSVGNAEIGPTLVKRTLKAHTRVDDGGMAVLGMLVQRDRSEVEAGPPYLKDTPVLGNLLTQRLESENERRIVIAIEARIERSADERLADSIRIRTAHERALARHAALRGKRATWALLVATRTSEADARGLAEEIGDVAGKRARVVAWTWDGAERWDVVVAGFAHAIDAVDALPELEALGWSPELVAPLPR